MPLAFDSILVSYVVPRAVLRSCNNDAGLLAASRLTIPVFANNTLTRRGEEGVMIGCIVFVWTVSKHGSRVSRHGALEIFRGRLASAACGLRSRVLVLSAAASAFP